MEVRPLGVLNLSLKFQTNHKRKPLIRGL